MQCNLRGGESTCQISEDGMHPGEDGLGGKTGQRLRLHRCVVLDCLHHRLAYTVSDGAASSAPAYNQSLAGEFFELLL